MVLDTCWSQAWGAELGVGVDILQSNDASVLAERVGTAGAAGTSISAIVINPAGFCRAHDTPLHTALQQAALPVVEVHCTNAVKAGPSTIAPCVDALVYGLGIER